VQGVFVIRNKKAEFISGGYRRQRRPPILRSFKGLQEVTSDTAATSFCVTLNLDTGVSKDR